MERNALPHRSDTGSQRHLLTLLGDLRLKASSYQVGLKGHVACILHDVGSADAFGR
jgi:hypothetical protein